MTTSAQPRKRRTPGVTREKVECYLRENPDFFVDHCELLEVIRIPHNTTGNTVSLIERQLSVLREKSNKLQSQLTEIIEIARDNDALNKRLHQLTLSLLSTNDAETAMCVLEKSLHQYFQVDRVIVCCFSNHAEIQKMPSGFSFMQPDASHPFEVLLKQGEAWCGEVNDASLTQNLFGNDDGKVRSFAVTPLDQPDFRGLLVLGSYDAARFRPGMGLLYLRILGEIVAARLAALFQG
jgi:uncharacterized protein YigA (DUF484 family)